MTEETRIHEAGHTVVWTLEEEHLGPLRLVTALPNGEAAGQVLGESAPPWPPTPRILRARGRVLIAGAVAQSLAGFKPRGFESDTKRLARLGVYSKHPKRLTAESFAGAEFQLRMHWGAVLGVAALLGELGELTPPSGTELIRMELRKPPRPLATEADTFVRLAASLENVPELREPLEAALRQVASAA